MSEVKTYFSEDVKITAGTHTLTGTAKGTFVSVKEIGDGITAEDGNDGEVARSMKRYARFEITVTLMQTSVSNDFLSSAYALDRLAGQGMMPVTVRDLNGTTLVTAPEAWVKKLPDADFAETSGNRSWVIETGKSASAVIGGIS